MFSMCLELRSLSREKALTEASFPEPQLPRPGEQDKNSGGAWSPSSLREARSPSRAGRGQPLLVVAAVFREGRVSSLGCPSLAAMTMGHCFWSHSCHKESSSGLLSSQPHLPPEAAILAHSGRPTPSCRGVLRSSHHGAEQSAAGGCEV